MKVQNITIPLKVYSTIQELEEADRKLILLAQETLTLSYSPYSNFKVGAAAILEDKTIIYGSNQENCSYGVTLCAERVLVAGYRSSGNKSKIKTIAISYKSMNSNDNIPVTPCGICRQTLSELEIQQKDPIRLLLHGQSGEVWEIETSNNLLPLSFNSDMLTI